MTTIEIFRIKGMSVLWKRGIFSKQYAYGTIICRERFDGEETENGDLYDGLHFKYSGRVYCSRCKGVLGNRIENTVSKSVEKKLKDGRKL